MVKIKIHKQFTKCFSKFDNATQGLILKTIIGIRDNSTNAGLRLHKVGEYFSYSVNMNISDFPVVEVQYWTRNIERACVGGELAYSRYKQRDLQKIHAAYKKDPEGVYDLLPIFYEASGGNIRRLSPEQALFKMYPEIKDKKDVEEPDGCPL